MKALCNQSLVSIILPLSLILCLAIFFSQSSYLSFSKLHYNFFSRNTIPPLDPCTGRYIYMYDLPEKFNVEILRDCKQYSPWFDLCPTISNSGLGPRMNNSDGMFEDEAWYKTDQFSVSVIFHNRMKQYGCLTTNYSISNAVYVPYYAGLDISRHLWDDDTYKIDLVLIQLVEFLRTRPEWAAKEGRDHFLVVGRTMWDFERDTKNGGGWGSNFTLLPEVKNMTILTIESRVKWQSNEFGIPYPTYFHPSKESEVILWQEKVRSMERPWLFSFVGASRPELPRMVRNYLIDQCANSTKCKLQQCQHMECYSPSFVMRIFESSTFCLQPRGDSQTRKSSFDAMLAGCIPVFFNPKTAYSQYIWHLPKNFNKFSVYIPEEAVIEGRVNVEDVLLGYSDEQIREMREEMINLIPTLVYYNPEYKSEGLRDAFDIAVDGVIELTRQKLQR